MSRLLVFALAIVVELVATPRAYAYDPADRLTAITQGSAVVTPTYDDAGRLLTLTYPNGMVATSTYDPAGRLATLTYTKGATTIGDLGYGYDPAGRRTTAGGSLARVGLPAAVSTTTYNAANQLTKWANNQTKPVYDANGNLTADGTYGYVWNSRNQLVQIKSGSTVIGSFSYDALGRRLTRTASGTTTGFALGAGNVIAERVAGSVTATLLTGGTDQTFRRTDGATERFLVTDALGSTLALVDAAGTVQTSYTYEPYGRTTVTGAASANRTGFTGRENDGPLYFYRARYLHPTFGRFVSEDPLGMGAGDPNLYRYVGGDPVNATDPSGLVPPVVAACAGGAILGAGATIVGDFLGGRKTTLEDVLGSAALGCGSGLVGFGIGSAIGGLIGGGSKAAVSLPTALTVGRNAQTGIQTYLGWAGNSAVYTGITNNIIRRQLEHGAAFRIQAIAGGLTRGQARAIEQAIIVHNPAFRNVINSISPSHTYYNAVAWGSSGSEPMDTLG